MDYGNFKFFIKREFGCLNVSGKKSTQKTPDLKRKIQYTDDINNNAPRSQHKKDRKNDDISSSIKETPIKFTDEEFLHLFKSVKT